MIFAHQKLIRLYDAVKTCILSSSTDYFTKSVVFWQIGFFEDENKYSVLPKNWIYSTQTGDFCRWPRKQRVTDLMLIKADEPNMDWLSFPVTIIGESYDSYDKAALKEKEIFLSESERSLGRGKRKRKEVKNHDDDTDSGMMNAYHQSYSEQLNLNETSQQETLNTQSVLDSSNIVNHNTVSDKLVESDEMILLKNIFSYIKRLDGRMDRIEKLLVESSSGPVNKQPLDDALFSIFPINDFQNLLKIDEKVKNEEHFEKKMVSFISAISGKNIKNFVKRILQRLFTNELSSKCSWTGFRNNFRLENLKIINIMKEIGRVNFSCTDVVFEEHVKEWFRHEMVGRKKKIGARPYKTYDEETLQRAVFFVKSHQMTERQAAKEFGISKSTIHRKRHDQNRSTSSGNSWLESFEEHMENKRSNETSVRIKKKRLTVPPGRSVAELVETNVEHEDIDGDIEVIFDCDNIIQPDSDTENVGEQNNPILIIVPPDDQLPSSSGTQAINSEKEDNIENIILSLKVTDFIQVKYLYDKNTKKSTFKHFVCQIKAITKSIKGLIFISSFMRGYKRSKSTFVYPDVEDIMEVTAENIVKK
ncbi:hypothetical protein ACI65C_013406 [Semiaphis heraclei]